MNKEECIKNLNSTLNPYLTQQVLFLLISEFLTENNVKNPQEMINLINNYPMLLQQALPTVIDYFVKKYNICKIKNNNQIILYYDCTN